MRILWERKFVVTHEMMAGRTYRVKPECPRSPGVHVQACNQALGIAAGKLSDSEDAKFPFERMTDETLPLMMALGVFWEEARASFYSEEQLIWSPGELERDGIFGTPDGYLFGSDDPDSDPCSWECKRSTKKVQSIANCWMYLKQGLSYYAMGAPARVLYDVLWVCGDYMRPYQPICTSSLVEFTEQEATSWWEVVKKAAMHVKPEC